MATRLLSAAAAALSAAVGAAALGGAPVAPCGGAPVDLLPFPPAEGRLGGGGPGRRLLGANITWADSGEGALREAALVAATSPARRRLLIRPGVGATTLPTGCNGRATRVPHEHDGPGPDVKKAVRPGEEPLVNCLHNVKYCDDAAAAAARRLAGVVRLRKQAGGLPGLGRKRFGSCALVGNGPSVKKAELGEYIDAHDVVVRFNLANVNRFQKFVGTRTSYRVIDHRQSVKVCCLGKYAELLDDDGSGRGRPGVVLWFPSSQAEILDGCKRRFSGNARYGLSPSFVKGEVEVMKELRKDLQRLGFGPFGPWLQLTTGAHAVLLFARICDSLSLYGFTTYDSSGPDQYTGQAKKIHSGAVWHDWKGEKHAWRALHAAGVLNLCSI